MDKKKTLTKLDVKNVALLLLKINGETTNLDIKKELRDNDYYATQEDVANWMIEISEEDEIDFSFNGTFRMYYSDTTKDTSVGDVNVVSAGTIKDKFWSDEEDDDLDENDSISDASIATFVKGVVTSGDVYVNKKSGNIITPFDASNLPAACWKVESNDTDKVLYFDASLNREEVRYAFYKIANLSKGSNYKASKITF